MRWGRSRLIALIVPVGRLGGIILGWLRVGAGRAVAVAVAWRLSVHTWILITIVLRILSMSRWSGRPSIRLLWPLGWPLTSIASHLRCGSIRRSSHW